MVKKHEDFPRHIFRLFLLLGIQFRWLLTRGTLGKALVTAEEAAIDDAKERAWMDMYDTDRDTLEDVLYRRLQMLWDPFTDALKVFQKHTASQPRCAQKVWEALLAAFPLDHKSMQTSLLARELARMMRWDGDTFFFSISISVLCGKRTGIVFLIFFLFTLFLYLRFLTWRANHLEGSSLTTSLRYQALLYCFLFFFVIS
jgi:hypothetical protein